MKLLENVNEKDSYNLITDYDIICENYELFLEIIDITNHGMSQDDIESFIYENYSSMNNFFKEYDLFTKLDNYGIIKEEVLDSLYTFGNVVNFTPMQWQSKKYDITQAELVGEIIAVRFTKAKVFYDIVDDYWGYMFKNVDSALISK